MRFHFGVSLRPKHIFALFSAIAGFAAALVAGGVIK